MGLFSIICCQKNEGYKLSLVVRKNLLQNLNCYVLFYYLPSKTGIDPIRLNQPLHLIRWVRRMQ